MDDAIKFIELARRCWAPRAFLLRRFLPGYLRLCRAREEPRSPATHDQFIIVRRAHPPTILNRFASNGGSGNVRQVYHALALTFVKPVRRACARGSKFGQDASLTHVSEVGRGRAYVAYVASRRARAVRAKCSLAGLTTLTLTRGA